MVFVRPLKLPSLHIHFFFVRSGPSGVPPPFVPWQAVHIAPATWPWKMRPPNATIAGVAPGATGSAAAPASGCVPSGGFACACITSPGEAVKLGQGLYAAFAVEPCALPL